MAVLGKAVQSSSCNCWGSEGVPEVTSSQDPKRNPSAMDQQPVSPKIEGWVLPWERQSMAATLLCESRPF